MTQWLKKMELEAENLGSNPESATISCGTSGKFWGDHRFLDLQLEGTSKVI